MLFFSDFVKIYALLRIIGKKIFKILKILIK
jgi:hypothetical protein